MPQKEGKAGCRDPWLVGVITHPDDESILEAMLFQLPKSSKVHGYIVSSHSCPGSRMACL